MDRHLRETDETPDDRHERRWYLGFGVDGDKPLGPGGGVLMVGYFIGVELGRQGCPDRGRSAAEGYEDTTLRDFVHLQTLRLEPTGDCGDVVISYTELLAYLLGS